LARTSALGAVTLIKPPALLGVSDFGSRIGMNPRTRVIVSEFWEFLAFFVNSIVFLLIGDQIHFSHLAEHLDVILVAIVGMIMTRVIAIYLLSSISNLLVQSEITVPKQIVLGWGGLRGSVAIALALSIPSTLPKRETLIAVVFGVVLFTLLVQGLTIKPLLQWLNLLGDQPLREEYSQLIARQTALDRVLDHLTQTELRPGIDSEFYRYQTTLVKGEIDQIHAQIETLQNEHPNLQDFMIEQLREELLAIEANTYAELVRSGQLNRELAPLLQRVLESEEG
ncbi:MAG: sodium:proton antiporter, partial [Leptolyngbya sp. ERB_1_1]